VFPLQLDIGIDYGFDHPMQDLGGERQRQYIRTA
jgi:hypothetical protein